MAIALKQGKHTTGRTASRLRRQVRGRKRVTGTTERPRLVVFRSLKHIYAQLVDDALDERIPQLKANPDRPAERVRMRMVQAAHPSIAAYKSAPGNRVRPG